MDTVTASENVLFESQRLFNDTSAAKPQCAS